MLTDRFPQIRGLILDMDGVLWHDREPIGNLPEIFSEIGSMGLKVSFATNNATKSVSEFVHKLAGFGVGAARTNRHFGECCPASNVPEIRTSKQNLCWDLIPA